MCAATGCWASGRCSKPSRCSGSAGLQAGRSTTMPSATMPAWSLATARAAVDARRPGRELHAGDAGSSATDGRVAGAQRRGPADRRARRTVRARVVVNATGPWGDRSARLEDPEPPPLLRPTKGVHVMVPREPDRPPRRDHLHQPDRRPGDVRASLGGHGPTSARPTPTPASPRPASRATGRRRHLPAPLGQRALSRRAPRPRGRGATWAGLRPLLAADADRRRVVGVAGAPDRATGPAACSPSPAASSRPGAHGGGAGGPRLGPARRAPPRPPTDTEPLSGGETGRIQAVAAPRYRLRGRRVRWWTTS